MLDLNQLSETVQMYFTQLNEMEIYGWIASLIGLVLVITGIILY